MFDNKLTEMCFFALSHSLSILPQVHPISLYLRFEAQVRCLTSGVDCAFSVSCLTSRNIETFSC